MAVVVTVVDGLCVPLGVKVIDGDRVCLCDGVALLVCVTVGVEL